MDQSWVIAILVGVLQGVFEWLPISSEGNITIVLTALGQQPTQAVAYSLFLHAGTALSATLYYRSELTTLLAELPTWRPQSAFRETPTLSFLAVATAASGIVGMTAYLVLEQVVSALTGGAVIILIGVLLVLTGVIQRFATGVNFGTRNAASLGDALLVGSLQGLAILPGISRSGITTSALLFRGHDGPAAFRLSFLLSIPAALGGSLLAVFDGGFAGMSLATAVIALVTAAGVGYVTIDLLMRVVRRVSFWAICLGLGSLAIVGGLLVV
ncbi:UDP-diphosphatase [Haloferax sp. Atlit-6N]|uniref:undecaprenyl-diphosphate phosphatase n=1 Tax=Haloferax sp. Atlit-6N TaxID=2077205 RepID=UPI000E2343FD|nr:undecaprenyl-diphosphate phosphatase [Haloferax sp. Atlit-6N]REA02044.1 UDP-diphosphatase [Haloferax sp. Atlit-6N]